MSKRLNWKRQKRLEPRRIAAALQEIRSLGYKAHVEGRSVLFKHRGSMVRFYPYSGWATGKTIEDGRGLKKLLNQLKEEGGKA